MITTVLVYGALIGMGFVAFVAGAALLCVLAGCLINALLPDSPLAEQPERRPLSPGMGAQLDEIRHLPVAKR
jgi:hypothetical protein